MTTKQACYLPNLQAGSGGPLIGETDVKGASDGCRPHLLGYSQDPAKWVMINSLLACFQVFQNEPGTGKLISEFVFEGIAKSACIGRLEPSKVL